MLAESERRYKSLKKKTLVCVQVLKEVTQPLREKVFANSIFVAKQNPPLFVV